MRYRGKDICKCVNCRFDRLPHDELRKTKHAGPMHWKQNTHSYFGTELRIEGERHFSYCFRFTTSTTPVIENVVSQKAWFREIATKSVLLCHANYLHAFCALL